MKKPVLRLSALILMAVLTANAAYTAFAGASAPDEPSSWAAADIRRADALDLIPDGLDSAFSQPITRAESCALAVRLYESMNGEIAGRIAFDDTDDINVEKAAYIDVVTGSGDNSFSPGGTLTREQAAAMIARLAESVGIPLPGSNLDFADSADISAWAAGDVGRVSASGMINGSGDNKFAPKSPFTREQCIIIILRLYYAATGTAPEVSDEAVMVGGLMMYDQMLFENYNFSASVAQRYADAVNRLYEDCGGIDTYVLIPPSASELYLPEDSKMAPDQHERSMDYLTGALDGPVLIDMTELYMEHKQEYIYFRTDAHWTARGAFCAYRSLMDAMGLEYSALDTYESGIRDGFFGGLYQSIMRDPQNNALDFIPDDVEYFYPSHGATVKNYLTADMISGTDRLLLDPGISSVSNYYNIFLGGDLALGYIHSQIGNGESVMIVRDSYGHAFLPFLVDQFEHIYVVEPRYFNKGYYQDFALGPFMRIHGIETLVFLNSPMFATSRYWTTASEQLEKMFAG